MTIWPSEYEDTVNYRSREFISADDVTVRMIDENILSIWGDVWYNGKRLASSSWTDLSSFGAKYDGSDESIILQEAVDEMPAFGHLHISGPLSLGTPVVCNETLTITGEGWQSPITPASNFPGGALLEIRHIGSAEGSSFSHLAGVVLDNLVFEGKNRSIPCSGLKLSIVQESFFSRLRFWNIDGIGLHCYTSVRDSVFHTIFARQCGNYDRKQASIDISEPSTTQQDAHNTLAFYGLYSHIGAGDLLNIQSERPTTGPMRTFIFLGCKFHGVWSPGTTQSDGIVLDHKNSGRVVIRNARGVEFTNCRFHAPGPGFPLFHLGSNPLQPGGSSLTGMGLAQCSVGNGAGTMLGTVTGAANNELKFAVVHYFSTGMMVRATSSSVSGINLSTDYYVIRVDANTIKLASTYPNAEAGTAITTGSTGTIDLAAQELRIFVEEEATGTTVQIHPGVDYDGPSTRTFVNKSSQQALHPFMGSAYLDPLIYEGPITQNDLFNHLEVDGDINHDGTKAGFFGTTPIVKPTGVSVIQAMESLGLGSGLTAAGGSAYSEQPPLSRSAGTIWYMPSSKHQAIFTGTVWEAMNPTDPVLNMCCVVGNFDLLLDATVWSGVTGTGNITNYGLGGSVLNGSPNVNSVQQTDASNRKYMYLNGTSAEIGLGVNTVYDIVASDSFSMFLVKKQSVYAANTCLFGNRSNVSSPTGAGWDLHIVDTNGVHKLRIGDGVTFSDATSGNTGVGELRMILGVRDTVADNVNIYGTAIEAFSPDTTTASLVTVDAPRIGRSGGTGTQRAAMDFYAAGFRRKALTATEITTLKSWVTARFS